MTSSQENSAVPSIALTMMARSLAHQRYYGRAAIDWELQPRNWFRNELGQVIGATGEFYRIIDRISQGERP